jgi:hypothetical protein
VVGRDEYVPTFLLSSIRQLDFLGEVFERPANVDVRIARTGVRWPSRSSFREEQRGWSSGTPSPPRCSRRASKLHANMLPPVQSRSDPHTNP